MYSIFDIMSGIMFMCLFCLSILNIAYVCIDYGFVCNISFLKIYNTNIPCAIITTMLFCMTPIYARSFTTEVKMEYMESKYSEIVIINEPILK